MATYLNNILLLTTALTAQAQQAGKPSTFFQPSPPNYDVKNTFDVEAVPIF